MNYKLYVDDNSHYMDKKERYKAGEFETLEHALERAKRIVDEFLKNAYKKGMSSDKLYSMYTHYGEDPFIIGGPPSYTFNAWEYAKKRCQEMCKTVR